MAQPVSVNDSSPVSLSYRVPRYRISLVREAGYPTPSRVITDSRSAATALRPLFDGLDREQFAVCCLDAKHAIIGVNIVSTGSLTITIVHPREAFKAAILMNACALIGAHNHPSGDATPSPEDRVLTTRFRDAGELLGIMLLDHLILGEEQVYSFADQGWPV
ncbi:MAG: JAB domain-containing protein [Nitrospirota bacterium]|nr:JAB domain-containing protein [Nitrospirota bacterium]